MADSDHRQRIAALDGIRAIACLMVLLYHSFQFSGLAPTSLPIGIRELTLEGFSGVDIFIVLSGFCLFLPVAARPERFRGSAFARQRIRRIVPAYYASIVYVIALPFVLKGIYVLLGRPVHPQPLPSIGQLLSHLLFIHTLSPRTWDGINGSYWSLGLEAQFYVLLPLLVVMFRRRGTWALGLVIAVGLLWQATLAVLWHDGTFNVTHFLWGSNVFARLAEFGSGMLAAVVVARGSVPPRLARGCSLIGVAIAVGYLALEQELNVSGVATAIWGIAIGLVLVGVSSAPGVVRRCLEIPALTTLGLVSYSFYLVHQPTVYYMSQLATQVGATGWSNWLIQLTLGFGVVLVLALLGYRFLERPFLRTTPTSGEVRLLERVSRRLGRGTASNVPPVAEGAE